MKCNCCDNVLEESTTTFTVVKKNEVYVVENVPCLECPFCEHISFAQEVTKKLERYVSGRVVPAKTMKSWVYKWGDPIIEIPKTEHSTTTVNTQFTVPVFGTEGASYALKPSKKT